MGIIVYKESLIGTCTDQARPLETNGDQQRPQEITGDQGRPTNTVAVTGY